MRYLFFSLIYLQVETILGVYEEDLSLSLESLSVADRALVSGLKLSPAIDPTLRPAVLPDKIKRVRIERKDLDDEVWAEKFAESLRTCTADRDLYDRIKRKDRFKSLKNLWSKLSVLHLKHTNNVFNDEKELDVEKS